MHLNVQHLLLNILHSHIVHHVLYLPQMSRSAPYHSCVAKAAMRSSKRKYMMENRPHNSYFYIEKWTFKGMCEVFNRAKRDKKEAI